MWTKAELEQDLVPIGGPAMDSGAGLIGQHVAIVASEMGGHSDDSILRPV